MDDRRSAVPFDPDHFAKAAHAGSAGTPLDRFREIYATHHWAGSTSRSGAGASTDQTERLRAFLPELCGTLGVRRLLDAPCGDHSWMARVDLERVEYLGGDLVPEVIAENRARYGRPGRSFDVMDLTTGPLPSADILLCRDCLVHLSFADMARVLDVVARSDIRYLLTTTFPDQVANVDIVTGDWRPLNLQAAPFFLPTPELVFNEGCTEADGRFGDKSLALWSLSQIRVRQ